MASGDFKITIGSLIWDFSQYNPIVNWGYERNIEYFRFIGTSEKLLLDLLDNIETMSVNLRIITTDVRAQLNSGSSPGASLLIFLTTIRNTGTDPGAGKTRTTVLWHTFGTYTVAIQTVNLQQSAGEGNLYSLDLKILVQTGPG